MDIRKEALRYLGCRSEPDYQTALLLERAEKELSSLNPAFCCRIMEKSECGMLLQGNDIKEHLSGCERVVIFAATLGAAFEKLLRTAEISNMAYAVVLDAYGSAYIEDYCNRCEAELHEKTGGFFTWRYSHPLPFSSTSSGNCSDRHAKFTSLSVPISGAFFVFSGTLHHAFRAFLA